MRRIYIQIHVHLWQPPTRLEPFVVGTPLHRPEPTKERLEPTILSIRAIEITHLTSFTLLFQLRIQRYVWRNHVATWARGGSGSGVPEWTPAGFCVFPSDPDPESKIWEKPDSESLFTFGSRRSLCGHFLSKTWANYGWIDVWNRSLKKSKILKFEKLPDPEPDPDSNILEQERSRSLKK